MKELKCPRCGSSNIATERSPDGSHICGECHYYWPNGPSENNGVSLADIVKHLNKEQIRYLEHIASEMMEFNKKIEGIK